MDINAKRAKKALEKLSTFEEKDNGITVNGNYYSDAEMNFEPDTQTKKDYKPLIMRYRNLVRVYNLIFKS